MRTDTTNAGARRRIATCALALSTFAAAECAACPVCHTETGKEVRAGIFDDDFGKNVALTLAPFPLLIGVVALIHFGVPAPKRFRNK